ncbi:response regulator transcription factor [Geodermatophilus sp. SYSU D00965]
MPSLIPRPGGARPADGVAVLTDRDVELLRHLAEGRSTAQIAAAMAVTSNTARTRIRRVRGKLAAAGRPQVVAAARGRGVI